MSISCRLWCWNTLLKWSCLAVVTSWILHPNWSFALCQSASDYLVEPCQALFRCTSECVWLLELNVAAPYTWTTIVVRTGLNFCSYNKWDFLANFSSTLAFTDANIFSFQIEHFFYLNSFRESSSTVRDGRKRFCWRTSRENSHTSHSIPIAISLEDISAIVFLSLFMLLRIGVQLTTSVLIMQRIMSCYQQLLFTELNTSELRGKPGSSGTHVTWLLKSSSKFLAYWYLSRQYNMSLTQPKSSWCNSSGCLHR